MWKEADRWGLYHHMIKPGPVTATFSLDTLICRASPPSLASEGVSSTGLKHVISSRGLLIVREILYSNQITYSNQHIKSYKNFLFILM